MLRNYGTENGYLCKPDSMNHNNSDKGNNGSKPSGNGFQAPPGGDFGDGNKGFARGINLLHSLHFTFSPE